MKSNSKTSADEYRKRNPYRVPEGYFSQLPDRVLERIQLEEKQQRVKRRLHIKPLYYWVSGVAAMLMMGWFGFRSLIINPIQSQQEQDDISLFLEFSKGEFNEGILVDYWVENELSLSLQDEDQFTDMLEYNPDWIPEVLTESIVY